MHSMWSRCEDNRTPKLKLLNSDGSAAVFLDLGVTSPLVLSVLLDPIGSDRTDWRVMSLDS